MEQTPTISELLNRTIISEDFDPETGVLTVLVKRFDSSTGEDTSPLEINYNIDSLQSQWQEHTDKASEHSTQADDIQDFLTRFEDTVEQARQDFKPSQPVKE